MLDYSEPRAIPDEVLALPIAGANLREATFGAELGRGALLLSFLRHFG
ncbi:MAG: hypothetical protein JNM84_19445 [Planctomycetes bacterium]|nr:hypothetical protein [Planctomycetota bacterium]